MSKAHTFGTFQVMMIAILLSILFVGEIRSGFPGSVPSYCTLNPSNCITSPDGGQKLKRQLKKV